MDRRHFMRVALLSSVAAPVIAKTYFFLDGNPLASRQTDGVIAGLGVRDYFDPVRKRNLVEIWFKRKPEHERWRYTITDTLTMEVIGEGESPHWHGQIPFVLLGGNTNG